MQFQFPVHAACLTQLILPDLTFNAQKGQHCPMQVQVWVFKLNSALAISENWDLEDHTRKVDQYNHGALHYEYKISLNVLFFPLS